MSTTLYMTWKELLKPTIFFSLSSSSTSSSPSPSPSASPSSSLLVQLLGKATENLPWICLSSICCCELFAFADLVKLSVTDLVYENYD